MVPGEAQPVQVVLDALPSEANSSAFGASLQRKFLEADGIRLDALTVDPVQNIEVTDTGDSQSEGGTENRITFSFGVSTRAGNANGLKDLLQRLERSIRPINLTNVVIEAQGESLLLKADGYTYYEPAQTVELKDKTVKP